MANYFLRLNPPRSTFPGDITESEMATMHAHAEYTQRGLETGRVLAYGPVMAADGGFGIALLEAENDDEVRAFGDGDPSVTGGLMHYEFWPMRLFGFATGKAE